MPPCSHFGGKSAYEHLIEARKKGFKAAEAVHGIEPPGSVFAGIDAARDTSILLALLWMLLTPFALPFLHRILLLSLGALTLLLWKTSRSAFWGWSHLERVHRLILQEKWEIDHHRAQEKEELLELYHAKGFKDKQLEDVVEVLMADDNRLLQVMLEEELGLTLGSFEHPLKQCMGAFLGVLCASIFLLVGVFSFHHYGLYGAGLITIVVCAILSARHLDNDRIKHGVWSLGTAIVSLAVPYFLYEFLLPFFKTP